MAIRVPTTLYNFPVSPFAFSQEGATLVFAFKRVTDPAGDQAICTVRPTSNSHRHELQFTAADTVVGQASWYAATTPSLGAATAGWCWGAIKLYRVGGAPRIKFYFRAHPAGAVTSGEISDGGAETATGSVITDYSFALGEGVAPWVLHGGVDYAYVKAWTAALSDAEISAEMSAFAQVRTANEHSYLTGVSKANIAAALVDESGLSNNWSVAGTLTTIDDDANPGSFGGTQPTIALVSATPSGAVITAAGTLTSAAGSPTVSVQLLAGATGTTQTVSGVVASGNWTASIPSVAPGVYTLRATVSDANGQALAVSSVLEVVGLSGSGELPHIYNAGSIVMTPESASVSVSGTQVLTIRDQAGLPLDGVVVTSSAPNVASVTSPSNLSGQVTVTGVSAGAATIQAVYSDPISGTLADATAISVALLVPSAPTGLTAVALGSSGVRLAWSDTASNETQFRVERAAAAAGPWVQILTPAANVLTVDDLTAPAGTTQFYRVRAANGDGSSGPSNTASVAVPLPADTIAPTITLSASSQSVTAPNSTVVLTASAADNIGVTEVRFYRGGVQIGGMLTAPNAGSQYQVQQVFGSSSENGAVEFTARAWDAAGNSTLSSTVTVTVAIPAPVTAPAAPSGLVATLVTQTSAQLGWTANALNATAYQLEQRIGAGPFAPLVTLAADVTSYTLAGLLANTTYTHRVRAIGAQAASGYSAEVSFTTLAAAVTGLTALEVTPSVVSAVPGVSSVITYTARNGNGSTRPGVTITPVVGNASVATVAPANGLTDASGKASFTVTMGGVIGQTQVLASASDGSTTLSPPATPAVEVFTLPAFSAQLVKELQAEQQDPKYDDEIQPYVFDFSPNFGRGEAIRSILAVTSTPTNNQAADPASATMIFGAAQVVGSRVLQYVRDGVPGVAYYLRCKVETTIGRVVISEIRIRIYRSTGARVGSSSPVVD